MGRSSTLNVAMLKIIDPGQKLEIRMWSVPSKRVWHAFLLVKPKEIAVRIIKFVTFANALVVTEVVVARHLRPQQQPLKL